VAAADIGTGSGAVAISIAKEIEDARVYATDTSSEALAVAAENGRAAGVSDRIDFLEGDLLEPLPPDARGTLDVIVSNPPYVPTAEIDALPAEISRYEPRGALDGGADGLSVLRRIIEAAPDFLRPGGLLALEIGEAQADAVSTMMKDRFDQITVLRDLSGLDRVATGQTARPSRA
jgi:release factor glutamine methyltransferase